MDDATQTHAVRTPQHVLSADCAPAKLCGDHRVHGGFRKSAGFIVKDHHAPGRFIKYVSYSHARAEIAIPAVYARQTRPKACTMCLLAHTCMGDLRFAGLQCTMERNRAHTQKCHGCTVPARGATRARGSLASRRAVRAARCAVDARQLLETSSETGGGGGSSNDSSTRSCRHASSCERST